MAAFCIAAVLTRLIGRWGWWGMACIGALAAYWLQQMLSVVGSPAFLHPFVNFVVIALPCAICWPLGVLAGLWWRPRP
jgi:uncharacterized membrane protein YjjP (DUF1212 family)